MKVPTTGILLLVLAIHLDLVSGQDANCDFSQNVQVGQTYYVYSPGYPNYYPPGVTCRWIATCPTGYNCRLDCSQIQLPQSQNCLMDRLLISRSGDASLAGADVFCGTGSTSITSAQQRISIGLITSYSSTGGRFMCTLTAVSQTPINNCTCGWKKANRIVGGVTTGVNEFPSMAALFDMRISEIKCGATILSPRYLATAAHCMDGHTVATMAVVVGEHDITVGDSPATQALQISRLLRHPSFNSNNYDYDIGLVTTATEIVFSDRVGPACLPFKWTTATFAGTTVTALGWGTLAPGAPKPDALQKVDLNVISNANCQAYISSVTPRQICTHTPGKDACQDDSGGPLLYQDPSSARLYLVGIISSGSSCASPDYPGVSTRTTSHFQWIEDNTPGANYCQVA